MWYVRLKKENNGNPGTSCAIGKILLHWVLRPQGILKDAEVRFTLLSP